MIDRLSILKSSPSLGLIGDGDDIDLLRAIESSFAVSFGEETARWTTVGDVYQALLSEIPVSSDAGKCSTMMAFHRLRNALSTTQGCSRKLKPATKLHDVITVTPRRFFQELSSHQGLKLPQREPSWLGQLGQWSLLTSMLVWPCLLAYPRIWPALALLPVGWLLMKIDPGRFGAMTLGDLSRAVAVGNFRQFAQLGAGHQPQRIWEVLVQVIAQECDVDPGIVTAETYLMG